MDLYLLKFPYRKILLPLAKKLTGVDPDILGYAASAAALLTGACYIYAVKEPFLLIAAVLLTLLRMTLNTIDGVIAIEQKKDTLTGEIVNALPDRYSDIFLICGIALSAFCSPVIGILGLASVFLVSYTGMLGKAVGVEWQHHGPLGKVERLITVMACTIWQYSAIKSGDPAVSIAGFIVTPMEICMMLFIVLGQVTVLKRLLGQLRQIRILEWEKKERMSLLKGKILVVCDSFTGNTQKAALQAALPLGAEVKKPEEASDAGKYGLVIIATPNIRKQPSPKITAFLDSHGAGIRRYSLIVTWGMPVWGPVSKALLVSGVRKKLGKKPFSVFSCRGFHAKYKTYRGRPSASDLKKAFEFGIDTGIKLLKADKLYTNTKKEDLKNEHTAA